MANIEKAAMVRENGNYIHPETSADVVIYGYENGVPVTVKQKLDEIMNEMGDMTFVPIAINEFTVTPKEVEAGGAIKSITINAKFNKTPTSIIINIGNNNYSDIDVLPGSTEFSYTISNILITKETNCRLAIRDNKGSADSSIKINKKNRYFYDTSNSFPGLTNLGHNYLATSKNKTIDITINNNDDHVYYCCPISNINDTVKFMHNNFNVTNLFTCKGITYLETKYDINTGIIEYTSDGQIIENFTSQDIINNDMNGTYETKITYAIYESIEKYNVGSNIIGFNIQ